jgi:uncharacterized OsmC-like protein
MLVETLVLTPKRKAARSNRAGDAKFFRPTQRLLASVLACLFLSFSTCLHTAHFLVAYLVIGVILILAVKYWGCFYV